MLRIGKLTDYAIVLLASMANEPKLWTARDLARQSCLPLPTVSKILKMLTKGGLLESSAGSHGGYELKIHPEKLLLGRIIEAIEGKIALTQCSEGNCDLEHHCPTKQGWQGINHVLSQTLAGIPLKRFMKTTPIMPTLGPVQEAHL